MKELQINTRYIDRESKSLNVYLRAVSKIPVLSLNEEIDFSCRIKQGDTIALERLVIANLRFVISIAKQYQNQGLAIQDLINEGNIGLIKAARRFDETKGFRFVSYAVWWIRQSILSALSEYARIVRNPSNKLDKRRKILKIADRLEQELQREPTPEEIFDASNFSSYDEITMLLDLGKYHLSLDVCVDGEEESNLLSFLVSDSCDPPDSLLMIESLKKEIHIIFEKLPSIERDTLNLFFGLNGESSHTLEGIAEKFGTTREYVRQIRERAIRRIKTFLEAKNLETYVR